MIRYRCKKCRARRTFRKRPEYYARPKKCYCGSTEWTVDRYRQSGRESKRFTCTCDGVPYPHRRGCRFTDLIYYCTPVKMPGCCVEGVAPLLVVRDVEYVAF